VVQTREMAKRRNGGLADANTGINTTKKTANASLMVAKMKDSAKMADLLATVLVTTEDAIGVLDKDPSAEEKLSVSCTTVSISWMLLSSSLSLDGSTQAYPSLFSDFLEELVTTSRTKRRARSIKVSPSKFD